MAYFDDVRVPFIWRQALTARHVLVCGVGVFLMLAGLAALTALGADMPVRLSLLGRQGYAHAWIFNTGLAVWGISIFAVAVSMRDARHTCRFGTLLLGAGLVALAQWSAAPLSSEGGGSPIAHRVHTLYCVMALVGFALACAGRGLSVGRRPDIFSLAALYGVICAIAAFVFLPEFGGVTELVLAVLCVPWTLARLPTVRT